MTIARRYRILQRIVFLQSAFSVLLSVYVLLAHKKQYPLNITVSESPALDLSFLDMVTNRVNDISRRADSAVGAPVASATESAAAVSSSQFPFRFDRYCVVAGVPSVAVGCYAFRVGEYIHGQRIDSISPLGVVVGGKWYDYQPQNRSIENDIR